MNKYTKKQDQLTKIFSEYFSDDNFKCQIWAAFSYKNEKTNIYVFMTSSPLDSYSPEDAIAIRLSLQQTASFAAALETAATGPDTFGKGYQAAQSLDQSKSLNVKVGRSNETDEYGIALFFRDADLSHVITLSSFDAIGIAELLKAAVQAAIGQNFSMAGVNGGNSGRNGQSEFSGASPVHKKPTKSHNPLDSMRFDD